MIQRLPEQMTDDKRQAICQILMPLIFLISYLLFVICHSQISYGP
jgi:hypothetical protein